MKLSEKPVPTGARKSSRKTAKKAAEDSLDHIEAPLRPLAVLVEGLNQDPANARAHSDRNLETIRASLAGFRQQKPIVVDGANIVRAGNGTLEAARALGWRHIAAVKTTLQGAEAVAFAIADNRTSEFAGWDEEVLGRLLKSIDEDIGIDDAHLGAMFLDDELASLIPTGDLDIDGDLPFAPEFDVDTSKIEDVDFVFGEIRGKISRPAYLEFEAAVRDRFSDAVTLEGVLLAFVRD